MIIRPATIEDTLRVQELRKLGWRDNYLYPEGGVTSEVLEHELAVLPVPQADIDHFHTMLDRPENDGNNLVAVESGNIIGVVFYDTLANGRGDIGVFVDHDYRSQGVGTELLKSLIARTTNTLEVTIFARNPSRGLYKKLGFKEEGAEFTHTFPNGTFLPAQRLALKRD